MSVPEPYRHQFSRVEYEAMGAAGVFEPGLRVELIEGEVIEMMTPQSSRHATALQLIDRVLRENLTEGVSLRVQLPLALADDSEPEPDLAIVRGTPRDFSSTHPTTAQLVVEVADSSRTLDRSVKARLYATAEIPEYWLLDLVDRTLEVFLAPDDGSYRERQTFTPTDTIASSFVSRGKVRVSDLLP